MRFLQSMGDLFFQNRMTQRSLSEAAASYHVTHQHTCFNLYDTFTVCLCWSGGDGVIKREVQGVCEAQVPNQKGNTCTRAEPPSNSSPIVAAKPRNAIQAQIQRDVQAVGG